MTTTVLRRGTAAMVVAALAFVLAGGASATRVVAAPPPATCRDLQDPITVTSIEQVPGLLAGTWLRCGESSAFGPVRADEVGFQVIGDRLYRVDEAPDGTLVRRDGADQEARVDVIDMTDMNGPGSYQVNVNWLGGGTQSMFPTFFASPEAIRFVHMVGISDYLRSTGPDPVPEAPPATPSCDRLRELVTVTSADQVRARLEGTWIRCGGSPPFGSALAGEVGFVVTGDRLYRVYEESDGTLVRDPEAVGDVVVRPDNFQVEVSREGGLHIVHTTFFASPDALRLSHMTGITDYLRWTGADPVASSPPVAPTTTDLPGTGPGSLPVGAAGLCAGLGLILMVAARRRVAGPTPVGRDCST